MAPTSLAYEMVPYQITFLLQNIIKWNELEPTLRRNPKPTQRWKRDRRPRLILVRMPTMLAFQVDTRGHWTLYTELDVDTGRGHWTLYTELPGHSLDLGVVNSWPISLPQPRFGCTLVSQTHRWIGGLLDVFSPVESNEYLSSSSPSLTSYSKSLASSLTSYTKSDHHQRNHWYHNYQFGGCSPLLIPPNNNTWLHRLQRIFVTAIITIKFDISLV